MKTKSKILSGLVLSAVLAGGLYANNCDMSKKGERGNCDKSSCMMQKDKSHKMMGHKGEIHFLGMFKELNLTDEQKTKVEQIISDSRKNMKSLDEAFTKDGFDKTKYVQIMNEKRDNMIKSEAEVIEKSYAILTAKQKEQLKVLMDLRKEKMNQKFDEKIKG
ncbi:MAG: Spy/CpxP family protein refolding chaperone [Aliarcobacter sp.]|nr:Spy/CpxP family protein refolding chaperone [Aliarcobacter sp.]